MENTKWSNLKKIKGDTNNKEFNGDESKITGDKTLLMVLTISL